MTDLWNVQSIEQAKVLHDGDTFTVEDPRDRYSPIHEVRVYSPGQRIGSLEARFLGWSVGDELDEASRFVSDYGITYKTNRPFAGVFAHSTAIDNYPERRALQARRPRPV